MKHLAIICAVLIAASSFGQAAKVADRMGGYGAGSAYNKLWTTSTITFNGKVTGKLVVEGIARTGCDRRVVYLPHRNDVVEFLAREVRPGDLVLTMGCGDVWMLGDAALERIEEAS